MAFEKLQHFVLSRHIPVYNAPTIERTIDRAFSIQQCRDLARLDRQNLRAEGVQIDHFSFHHRILAPETSRVVEVVDAEGVSLLPAHATRLGYL